MQRLVLFIMAMQKLVSIMKMFIILGDLTLLSYISKAAFEATREFYNMALKRDFLASLNLNSSSAFCASRSA